MHLVKAAAVRGFLTLLTEQLVEADDFFALARFALEQQRIGLFDCFLAVERGNAQIFAVLRDRRHTGRALSLDFFHVAHAVTLHADGIDSLTQDAVLF